MQREEIIQQIIQMADKFYKKPDEFISKVRELLENVSQNKNDDPFSYIGLILFNLSYFNLALHWYRNSSWGYAFSNTSWMLFYTTFLVLQNLPSASTVGRDC
jgi:hypothetical protein